MIRSRYSPKLLLVTGYILGVLGIVACGGGGSDDEDDEDDGTTYNYTVTSATWFTGGQQVAVVRFGIIGNCSSIAGVTSDITRVGSGTVVTPGTVSFSFTTEITPPFAESVYIDNNASGNLDNGDRVWGDNPNDFAGACFDTYSTDQTFDWEDVAAQFQVLLGLSQPSIIYTGVQQAFRSESSSELMSKINNAIIVDGDGYNSVSTVTVDIIPGVDPIPIDLTRVEVIPVAVLGSIVYDATQIDFSTVVFGRDEALPVHDGHVEDVNSDGFMDMVFHFKTQETGIVCGDTHGTLKGRTFNGTPFIGTDNLESPECN